LISIAATDPDGANDGSTTGKGTSPAKAMTRRITESNHYLYPNPSVVSWFQSPMD